MFPDDGAELDTLLTNAGLAMRHAKRSGRQSYAFFSAELNDKAVRMLRWHRKKGSAVISLEGTYAGHTTAAARSLSVRVARLRSFLEPDRQAGDASTVLVALVFTRDNQPITVAIFSQLRQFGWSWKMAVWLSATCSPRVR